MAKKTTMRVPAVEGARILAVRPLTQKEKDNFYIDDDDGEALALVLDTGVTLVALSDEEGNGFGCFAGVFGKEMYLLTNTATKTGKE